MQITYAAAVLALAASASASPVAEADPTFGSLINWWQSFVNKYYQSRSTVPAWPPAVPNSNCPTGWPKPITPWNQYMFRYPGPCKPKWVPVYRPGCIKDTKPQTTQPAPQTTATKTASTMMTTSAAAPTTTPSAPTKFFNILAPELPLGSIFDGQLQANSPYPAIDVAAVPSKGPASVNTQFYLDNGALFDQYGRACEISSGNQLQCNMISNPSTAMKGFAIDPVTMFLEWNTEDTFYGCNIGTSDTFGQIIFTGTHKDFAGVSADTENPNCDAYHLTVKYV
ncbi:hypothetical protein BCR37DRAFT_379108 [Protomyces lactucae-debilis]|uniref:Cell wall mannoprotein PIR1-like C-terminal domain-containing protein n=1 Tax=Protomyces lactucae-debilis TaxID=2754530 RepID=A0A1Y2FGT1_PROLT|nr:uncharacterized protein BCR37DRAFT_379108 [Protomyces lactucae-debilis]ORY83139.1 hypothetical protein BCR37DRAFT_379108 [Protomyces lactucae-debilis]